MDSKLIEDLCFYPKQVVNIVCTLYIQFIAIESFSTKFVTAASIVSISRVCFLRVILLEHKLKRMKNKKLVIIYTTKKSIYT